MRILLWMTIALFAPLVFISCKNSTDNDNKCEGICQQLDSGYNKYVQKIDSIGKLRGEGKIAASIPISESIGRHYTSMFQKEYQARAIDQTHLLKISKENIEFLYKYMLENKVDTLGFAFAKYDTTGFAAAGIPGDDVYSQRAAKMKNRYTIVIGGWNPTENPRFFPFKISGLNFKFFDDWHNEDP